MNAQEPNTNRFMALDGWRGVFACMVALLHFNAYSHFYGSPAIRSAGFFVDYFFVLSGFVIFANYEAKLKQGYSFLKFIFLRFGRLYPLHITVLLAYVLVETLQIVIPQLQYFSDNPPFTNKGESLQDLVSHIFLFQALDTIHAKGFNAPSWSISAEFYTYIVFALAVITFKNHIHLFNVLICVSFGTLLFYIFGLEKGATLKAYEGFFRCLSCFAAGGLCWAIWKKYNIVLKSLFQSKALWSGCEILALVVIYFYIVFTRGTAMQYLTPIVFSVTLLLFAFERGIISDILKNRFFQLLGLLSYSIYMVHGFISGKLFPPIVKLSQEYLNLDIVQTIDNVDMYGQTLWQGDAIYILYLAVIICASYISYKLIEEPARNLSRKLVRSK